MKYLKDKGFTTIELMVAILIAGIIMGAVGSFLTFHIQSFNANQAVVNTQYEGQLAMNQLTDIAMASEGITAISNLSGTSLLTNTGVVTPYKVTFRQEERLPSGVVQGVLYELTYDQTTATMTMIITRDGLAEPFYIFATHVIDFKIQANDGLSFGQARAINVNMSLQDGDAKLELQTQVKFRNKR